MVTAALYVCKRRVPDACFDSRGPSWPKRVVNNQRLMLFFCYNIYRFRHFKRVIFGREAYFVLLENHCWGEAETSESCHPRKKTGATLTLTLPLPHHSSPA